MFACGGGRNFNLTWQQTLDMRNLLLASELIARGGTYARLHDLQFADDDMLAPAQAASADSNAAADSL